MSSPDDRHSMDELTEEEQLELLAESYLDGLLPPQETAAFERRLLEPAVADAFREALMLRALLAEMPPDAAPEELVASLEAALVADVRLVRKAARMPRLRAALAGMSWMVRGPAQALAPASAASGGPEATAKGLSTLRYALGPLAQATPKLPRPSGTWWKRLLARSLRRKPKEPR